MLPNTTTHCGKFLCQVCLTDFQKGETTRRSWIFKSIVNCFVSTGSPDRVIYKGCVRDEHWRRPVYKNLGSNSDVAWALKVKTLNLNMKLTLDTCLNTIVILLLTTTVKTISLWALTITVRNLISILTHFIFGYVAADCIHVCCHAFIPYDTINQAVPLQTKILHVFHLTRS